MNEERGNFWDLATLMLWAVFFAVGLVPELVYYILRDAGNVIIRTAFVNTSAVITVSFTAYLAIFVFRQCRASGLSDTDSRGRALQVTILGIAAFLEIPAKGATFDVRTLLEIMVHFRELPDPMLRVTIVTIGASKIISWCYLFSLVLRYHAFANRDVFAKLSPLFASLRQTAESPAPVKIVEAPPVSLTRETLTKETSSHRN